jgi:hypothetical protein
MSIYTDSNTAQLAYKIDSATKAADVTTGQMKPLNVLSDTLKPSIEVKTSDDIRDDGQYSSARTVGGSAAGGVNCNFRYGEYDDFLAAAFRNDWTADTTDASGKTHFLWNGNKKVPFLLERRFRRVGVAPALVNDYRRFYSQFLSSMTINLPNKDFVQMSLNFMGLGFEYSEAAAGVNGEGGKLTGITYTARPNTDPFDSSNSITALHIRNQSGVSYQLVMEQGAIEFNSNLREDNAVGHGYAANIGFGRFRCSPSGTFYFRNQEVLDTMMKDQYVQMEVTFEMGGNKYEVYMPYVKIMQNDEELSQVDTTMRSPLNMQAFPKNVTILGASRSVTAYIKRVAA